MTLAPLPITPAHSPVIPAKAGTHGPYHHVSQAIAPSRHSCPVQIHRVSDALHHRVSKEEGIVRDDALSHNRVAEAGYRACSRYTPTFSISGRSVHEKMIDRSLFEEFRCRCHDQFGTTKKSPSSHTISSPSTSDVPDPSKA